jgi:hypothetical protein
MSYYVKYVKVFVIIPLVFVATTMIAQPGFTPPGQGGTIPPNPCVGQGNGKPCQPIPISGGIEFLIAAGMIIGIKKLYSSNKTKHN